MPVQIGAQEHEDNLFHAAWQPSASQNGDGKRNMGLGLSVCLAIVQAHGGDMDAKNLEEGAEVSFRLPITKEAA